MVKIVKSLFALEPDPEARQAQQDALRKIYAQHGVDYDEMREGLKTEGVNH